MKDITNDRHPLDNYGKLTEPFPKDIPEYDYRKVMQYCRMHNKTVYDLTEEEMELFRL